MHRTTRTVWTTPALRIPALAVVTWAVAFVLAVPLVPLVASPPAVAEAPRAARGTAPSASQAPTRLRVVNHNIEKRWGALQRSIKAARRSSAQVLLLQEVCWWQAAEVRRRHPAWTVSYIAVRNRDQCRRRGYAGDTLGLRRKVGNLAIWTGGPTGDTSSIPYDRQRSQDDNAGLACVSWFDLVRHRACSVHLIAPSNGSEIKTRTRQARDTARIAAPWVGQDEVVVLGGDFNAEPQRRTMKFLYKRGGKGHFREAGELRSRGRRCGCAGGTMDKRPTKIDYIFYSANRASSRAARGLRIVRTASDHHLLVGRTDVDASVR